MEASNPNSTDDVSLLKSRLHTLTRRVEELERQNSLLLSSASTCPRCSKVLASGEDAIALPSEAALSHESLQEATCSQFHTMETESVTPNIATPASRSGSVNNQGFQVRPMNHEKKRYVALKIMYFGQRFYGFASEAHMDPTIESEIFKALEKTKLLVCKKENSNYSRCGRTDKGVSSTGQVITLFARSNFRDANASEDTYEKEIDYVKVLNRALPKDIRVMGWCPVATDFHARFSCLGREYKYFFWKGTLDIVAMQMAAQKLVGEHDFRNFCKMDAANVSNYKRKITFAEISSCTERSCDDELHAITIRGSAFLWHQVRCMVAVLFMIGQGLESPTIIDMLLDTIKVPRKPQYVMAPDLPLVLRSCEFEDVKYFCSPAAQRDLVDELENMVRTYVLQAAIFHEALSCLSTPGKCPPQHLKKKRDHVPLLARPTEPSYDERCARLVVKNNIGTTLISQNTAKELSSVCQQSHHLARA